MTGILPNFNSKPGKILLFIFIELACLASFTSAVLKCYYCRDPKDCKRNPFRTVECENDNVMCGMWTLRERSDTLRGKPGDITRKDCFYDNFEREGCDRIGKLERCICKGELCNIPEMPDRVKNTTSALKKLGRGMKEEHELMAVKTKKDEASPREKAQARAKAQAEAKAKAEAQAQAQAQAQPTPPPDFMATVSPVENAVVDQDASKYKPELAAVGNAKAPPDAQAVAGPQPQTSAMVGPEPQTSAMVGPEPQTAAMVGPEPQTSAMVGPQPDQNAGPDKNAVKYKPELAAVANSTAPPDTQTVAGPQPQTSAMVGPEPQISAMVGPQPQTSAMVGPEPQTSAMVGPQPDQNAGPDQNALKYKPELAAVANSSAPAGPEPQTSAVAGPQPQTSAMVGPQPDQTAGPDQNALKYKPELAAVANSSAPANASAGEGPEVEPGAMGSLGPEGSAVAAEAARRNTSDQNALKYKPELAAVANSTAPPDTKPVESLAGRSDDIERPGPDTGGYGMAPPGPDQTAVAPQAGEQNTTSDQNALKYKPELAAVANSTAPPDASAVAGPDVEPGAMGPLGPEESVVAAEAARRNTTDQNALKYKPELAAVANSTAPPDASAPVGPAPDQTAVAPQTGQQNATTDQNALKYKPELAAVANSTAPPDTKPTESLAGRSDDIERPGPDTGGYGMAPPGPDQTAVAPQAGQQNATTDQNAMKYKPELAAVANSTAPANANATAGPEPEPGAMGPLGPDQSAVAAQAGQQNATTDQNALKYKPELAAVANSTAPPDTQAPAGPEPQPGGMAPPAPDQSAVAAQAGQQNDTTNQNALKYKPELAAVANSTAPPNAQAPAGPESQPGGMAPPAPDQSAVAPQAGQQNATTDQNALKYKPELAAVANSTAPPNAQAPAGPEPQPGGMAPPAPDQSAVAPQAAQQNAGPDQNALKYKPELAAVANSTAPPDTKPAENLAGRSDDIQRPGPDTGGDQDASKYAPELAAVANTQAPFPMATPAPVNEEHVLVIIPGLHRCMYCESVKDCNTNRFATTVCMVDNAPCVTYTWLKNSENGMGNQGEVTRRSCYYDKFTQEGCFEKDGLFNICLCMGDLCNRPNGTKLAGMIV